MLNLFLSHFRDMLGYTSCLIFTNIKKGKLKKTKLKFTELFSLN